MDCREDMQIDMPTLKIFARCPNPLMAPESCRTKGVHPPTEEQKIKYAEMRQYEDALRAERRTNAGSEEL